MGGGAARSGASRSVTSQQRLTITWEAPKLDLYQNIDPDDFLSALPADYRKSEKPLLVYLSTDSAESEKQTAQIEKAVFGDENVALGARVFRPIRLRGDKISKEHAHWRTLGGKNLPRVIVVDTAGQKVGTLDGRDLGASNLFKQMKKAAAKTYKTDLEKVVKESRSLLDQMDQITQKQDLLAQKKKNVGGSAAKEKELAAEEASLLQQMKDAQAREAELLKKVDGDRKVTKG